MGVIVDVQELSCSIPPSRFFKAFLADSDNLMPKLLSGVIKSIELIEGNGGPGSIKLFSYSAGETDMWMKHRVEELDETKHVYTYTLIDGSKMGVDFESVTCVNEVGGGADGGCVLKVTATYKTKGDNQSYVEEEMKQGRAGLVGFFNAAVAYLHSNPNEYN